MEIKELPSITGFTQICNSTLFSLSNFDPPLSMIMIFGAKVDRKGIRKARPLVFLDASSYKIFHCQLLFSDWPLGSPY